MSTLYNAIEVEAAKARGYVQLKNGTWVPPERAAKVAAKTAKVAADKEAHRLAIRATQDAADAKLRAVGIADRAAYAAQVSETKPVPPAVKPMTFVLTNDDTFVEFSVNGSVATITTRRLNEYGRTGPWERKTVSVDAARGEYKRLIKAGFQAW